MAKIKTINLNGVSYDIDAHSADSATSLSLSQLIDGVSFDGTSGVKRYIVSTDARQNKTLTINGFQVVDGARLIVRFNIGSAGADSPYSTYTLNVNNTGAKPISYTNLNADQQLALKTTLNDGSGANVIEFVYDSNLESWIVLSAGGGAGSTGVDSYGLRIDGHTVSLVENGESSSVIIPDNNTWQANTSTQEGYVLSGAGQANKVWKTDADGNPSWRDDEDTTYDIASSTNAGLVKLGSNVVQSVAANTPTTSADRTYPVQLNSADQMVVNIPWTDNNTWQLNSKTQDGYILAGNNNANKVWKTDDEGNPAWRNDENTTYSIATSLVEGLVKLGSDTKQTIAANLVSSDAGKTYAVQLNNNNQMVVNVPWVDNNTWQAASTTQEGYIQPLSGNNTQYLNGEGNWTTPPNDNTTYGISILNHTISLVPGGTNMEVTVPDEDHNTWQANTNAQEGYVLSGEGQVNKVWKTDASGNPAWRDDDNTTYGVATSSTLGLAKLGSDTAQTVAPNLVSSIENRTYAVQMNSTNQLMVNVPWVDNNTWQANTASQDGYVVSPNGATDMIWKTNSTTGTPEWSPLGDVLAVADAMVFKGTLGVSGTADSVPTNNYKVGDTYRIITAGTYANKVCEVGDLLVAVNDGPATGSTVINDDWTVAQTNIDGALYKGSVYANGQMLIAQGNNGAVSTAAVNPYIQFGTDTNGIPTLRTFVGGVNGDAIQGPTATTSAYGFTKLSSAINSTSEVLAATPAAVKAVADLVNTTNTFLNSGAAGQMLVATGNSTSPEWKTVGYTALNTGYTITSPIKMNATITNEGVLLFTSSNVGIASSGTIDVVTGFNGVVSSAVPNGNEVSY